MPVNENNKRGLFLYFMFVMEQLTYNGIHTCRGTWGKMGSRGKTGLRYSEPIKETIENIM